jgi:hypothetical protein
MKTKILDKENKKSGVDVDIVRRGFDHYLPIEQICTFLDVPFDGLKRLPDNLEMTINDVKQKDGSIKYMPTIHIKSIVKYFALVKEKHNLDVKKTAMFFVALHQIQIDYEEELRVMLEESYS